LALTDHSRITDAGADRPTITIPLTGEFDVDREGEMLHMVTALDVRAPTVVRLEMSRVTSVDFGGLRGMLAARAYLQARGCELELLRPNGDLRRVLDLTGLGEVLAVVDERP
jgi:anti-anti-sigma factor